MPTLEDTRRMLPEVTPFPTSCPKTLAYLGVSRAVAANAKQHLRSSLWDDKHHARGGARARHHSTGMMTSEPHPRLRSWAKPAEPGRGEGELLWPSGSGLLAAGCYLAWQAAYRSC